MAFLTIGPTNYDVLEGGAEQEEHELIGEPKRAIDGSMRSGRRYMKRRYRFTLVGMSQAAFNTLETYVIANPIIAITGDAVTAANYALTVSAGYDMDGATNFLRRPQVVLVEA